MSVSYKVLYHIPVILADAFPTGEKRATHLNLEAPNFLVDSRETCYTLKTCLEVRL